MKFKITVLVLAFLMIIGCSAFSEMRIYRQFKDVSIKENGDVRQSRDKKNLFECTYSVDYKNKTIKRVKIRRLDDPEGKSDDKVYTIVEKRNLWGSEAGRGGKVLVAVENGGSEILEMGSRFAFTTRTSPFSQIITGVYKRVYLKNCN